MIHGITQLGSAVRASMSGEVKDVLEALTKQAPTINEKKAYLYIINIKPSERKITYQPVEVDTDTGREYLFVDSPPSNADQDRVTTRNLAYLLSLIHI